MRIWKLTRSSLFVSILTSLAKNERGSAAIIFGLAFMPLFFLLGGTVDYFNATTTKTSLGRLADNAALAAAKAAAQKGLDCAQTKSCKTSDPEKAGIDAGSMILMGDRDFLSTKQTPNIQIENDFGYWTATVSYAANLPTSFLKIIGLKDISVGGKATAGLSLERDVFLNFYLLLDQSQSMGIGASSLDITNMTKLTGCAFGCHAGSYKKDYYDKPKANGIRFRIDDLRDATSSLVSQAKATQAAQQRLHLKMGVYAFNHLQTPIADVTDNLDYVAAAVQGIDLTNIDDGTQGSDAVNWLSNKKLKGSGNIYSSSSPLEIVFIVTDGVEDGIYTGWASYSTLIQRAIDFNSLTGSFDDMSCRRKTII